MKRLLALISAAILLTTTAAASPPVYMPSTFESVLILIALVVVLMGLPIVMIYRKIIIKGIKRKLNRRKVKNGN
jgi:uncharacterized integral membrane protein